MHVARLFSGRVHEQALAVAGAAVGVAANNNPLTSIYCQTYAAQPVPIHTQSVPLIAPQDIGVDGAGDIFVVDSKRREVIRIDALTSAASVLLGPQYLEVPVGLTISVVHSDLCVSHSPPTARTRARACLCAAHHSRLPCRGIGCARGCCPVLYL